MVIKNISTTPFLRLQDHRCSDLMLSNQNTINIQY